MKQEKPPLGLAGSRLLSLPRISDARGALSFIEAGRHIPMDIRRVFYLYDVPPGERRGGHAHKELEQLLIAISGSFDVHLDDGRERVTLRLSSPSAGLYIPPLIWADLGDFTPGAVCLALASLPYAETDYLRDYAAFQEAALR